MISISDFEKKQVVFVFLNQGEKLSFQNDNFIVRDKEGKIKFQCTCYRLFLVFAIGHGSITSGLMQRAKRFGFSIVMMTQSFRAYQLLGASMEGNTVLRQLQYRYDGISLARHITENKMQNQRRLLSLIRNKNEIQKEAIASIQSYIQSLSSAESLQEIMGLEGCASRVYFSAYFNNVVWKRRAPRVKCDMINTVLDIGYTMLFSFVDAVLNSYGFDVYCGVLHRNFYMRKSLVCDIVEPFRVLIDAEVKKAINLKQCREEDFLVDQGRYFLKWEKNAAYTAWLAKPIMENKTAIHNYVQAYYRAFMKQKSPEEFPNFEHKG